MATLRCPHCKVPWLSGKFCPVCGRALVPLRRCAHCEEPMMPYWKFCAECGEKQSDAD